MSSLRAIIEETRQIMARADGKPVAIVWPGFALPILTAEEWEQQYGEYLQVQMLGLAEKMDNLPTRPSASLQEAKAGTEAVVARSPRKAPRSVASHDF